MQLINLIWFAWSMFHKKTSFACYVGCVYLLQVSTFGAPKIFARGLYKTKKVAMTSLQTTNIFLTLVF